MTHLEKAKADWPRWIDRLHKPIHLQRLTTAANDLRPADTVDKARTARRPCGSARRCGGDHQFEELHLSYCKVFAPFPDGLSISTFRPVPMLPAGSRLLAARHSQMDIMQIREAEVRHMAPGSEASLPVVRA